MDNIIIKHHKRGETLIRKKLFEQLKEVTILEAAPPHGGGNTPVRPPGRGPGGIGSIFGRRLVWEDLTEDQAKELLFRWMKINRLSIPRPRPDLAKPLMSTSDLLRQYQDNWLQVRNDGIYYQDTNGFWHFWAYDEATGQFVYKKLGDSRTFDWRGNGLSSRRAFDHYRDPNAPAHDAPNIGNQGIGFGLGVGGGLYYNETGAVDSTIKDFFYAGGLKMTLIYHKLRREPGVYSVLEEGTYMVSAEGPNIRYEMAVHGNPTPYKHGPPTLFGHQFFFNISYAFTYNFSMKDSNFTLSFAG